VPNLVFVDQGVFKWQIFENWPVQLNDSIVRTTPHYTLYHAEALYKRVSKLRLFQLYRSFNRRARWPASLITLHQSPGYGTIGQLYTLHNAPSIQLKIHFGAPPTQLDALARFCCKSGIRHIRSIPHREAETRWVSPHTLNSSGDCEAVRNSCNTVCCTAGQLGRLFL
jgi:hypothetical protein